MMYLILLFIQCIIIVLLSVECWAIFKNWKGMMHSYLFLGCAAMLVNSVGYLFQLLSKTEETYVTALKLAYLGKVWITFALLLFVVELARIRIPHTVRRILAIFNSLTYIVVVTTEYTGLYYKSTEFYMDGRFPVFLHENGIWHHLWDAVLVLCILFGLTVLIRAWFMEKNPEAKESILIVSNAIMLEGLATIIQIFKLIPVTIVYDFTCLGFYFGSVLMFIGIFKYRLLDTETLAREYVIDELSEGIIVVNEKGNVSFHNIPALELFPDLMSDPLKVTGTLKQAVETEEPLKMGGRIYTPVVNQLYRNSMEIGTIYSLTDDTEHYRYMEELEEQKRIADEANKAKSSFLANMSHEIRTPINAVLGMDEMILRESREKEILSYAADIQTAGRTLLSLINDILDFSKIEEGRMEILPTQYELSSVIGDIVNMIRERAETKGLRLKVSVDKDIPHLLFGDAIRIKQVALNLLTNAVKYTEAGEVKLALGFARVSDDEIMLAFKISDTGIGMKEEDMDKLFSPFSRIEESRNRTIEGTGLGMSIVKQLLALMGCELSVRSVYGEGSEFSFEIKQGVVKWEPIGDHTARFEAKSGEREEYRELFHAPDARILVVDDTEVNLTVIQNLLKRTQVRIDTALSGREALSRAKENDYDVILIDHMMPEMDGIETLKRLKEEAPSDDTVYIVLTANAVSGARQRYLAEGFEDYIPKPVDGKRLEKMLKKYLPEDKVMAPKAPGQEDEIRLGTALNSRILVVDDDEVICAAASEMLGGSFSVICCQDGDKAVGIASAEQPALILLDIYLVGMTGFEVLQKLKEDTTTRDIPVMFITVDDDMEKEVMALKSGALDFIRKPFVPEVLIQRSKRIIALNRFQKDLQGEVVLQTGRAERLTKEMMLALSHTVDAKDHYTNGHSERVAEYAAEIGRRMGKSLREQVKLYEIGLLHDIGKIGVPEEIINKKEKLTDEEFSRIKEHTLIGNEILKGITDLPELTLGARSHHEKYDGSGYPDGLKKDEIPEVARIICVADCYDAMTSTRTYSKPKPQDKVREEIVRCSGTHFDPYIAEIMISMIDDDTEYTMNESGGGRTVWKGKEQLWDENGIKEYDTDDEFSGIVTDGGQIPQWIRAIPEIDADQGIKNCGSDESYLSVLKVFHQTAAKKADEIDELYESGDIPGYTVKVHALKSSARIIGAAGLSDMAQSLEAAGHEDDRETIERGTGQLLKAYRELDGKLAMLDGPSEGLKELSPDMRKEALQTIGEIAQSMDYGMMEDLLRDLKTYRLSPDDGKMLKSIEERLMQLDWDGIIGMIKQEESDG